MSNVISNNDHSNITFINADEYVTLNEQIKVLCSNNGVSAYISNAVTNITDKQSIANDGILRKILAEVSPTKITDICKLFNISYNAHNDLFEYLNLIFTCSSCRVVSKVDMLNVAIYGYDQWSNSNNDILYTYFNSNKPSASRVISNSKKNVMTLKIQNEELKEDVTALNILIKLNSEENYLLHIKAYVVNDAYSTIRYNTIFRSFFNLDVDHPLYNKIHLRDCALKSFNGLAPLEYVQKVYDTISTCNLYCGAIGCSLFTLTNNDWLPCNETAHYIQKFARNCFHTKYIITLHTAIHHVSACIYLAVILVRCNSRTCKDFLDTLPSSIKYMIMTQSGIGNSDESKADCTMIEKINLSQRINIWEQLFKKKYGMNVKRLIDRTNELILDDNKESMTDNTAEKDRLKKMINYFEKISTKIHFLKIHSELIALCDVAKNIYPNDKSKLCSVQGIIEVMMVDQSNRKHIFSGGLGDMIKTYLNNFNVFERSIRERLMKISEGQMSVKKAIWQYIISIISTTNVFSSKKNLCIIGPPGVGKTYIAIAIARILFFEAAENPTDEEVKNLVYILSVPSITSEMRLTGSDSVYVGAGPGVLAKELYFVEELCRKLIVYDEIDKTCKYTEQLLPILDYTQNSKVIDNYLNIEMDMKCGTHIATANDVNKIDPILRERMDIIYLNGYSVYTKCKLVQSQMLKSLLREKGLNENLIYLTDEVLEDIIIRKTREAGVRALKNLIMDIVSTVNLAIVSNMADLGKYINNSNNSDDGYNKVTTVKELYDSLMRRYVIYVMENKPIGLTKNDADLILADKHVYGKEDTVDNILNWSAGHVIGLYATGSGIGGILPIAVKFNKTMHKKELVITTGAMDTMKDSIQISTILASDYLHVIADDVFTNYFAIDKQKFVERVKEVKNNAGTHIILDSSIQKDGPSAGGAFTIGYLSQILNHPISRHVGITGEISSNFTITKIGGINMKINGGRLAGCRSIIIPKQNIDDMIKEIVYDNSIDCKNVKGHRVAFIYYCDKEQSYMLLVRTRPNNYINDNAASFDVHIDEGSEWYDEYTNDAMPSLYRVRLNIDKLITPDTGLNIVLFDDVRLVDIMRSHFVIIALASIPEIYYYMVKSKQVYENTGEVDNKMEVIGDLYYDGIELNKDN
jgi:DNA polymerase III delta prime subunit